MTYSIVARDPETGELGVAVATRWPGVGAVVPWVEPGVGAVATQASTNVALGPLGLRAMRAGRQAPEALRELVAGDADARVRQLGVVDAQGGSAAHTGAACVAEAGHLTAPDVSVQGNMLAQAGVLEAMHDAFAIADGDLADRLLVALRAGESAGGDLRGVQSAALVVTPGEPDAEPWSRRFDLRIDDSPGPLEEIARLLQVARAYEALDSAFDAAQAGELDMALDRAAVAHELARDDAQVSFWYAMILQASGRPAEAQPMLDAALRSEPRLAEFGRRYVEADHAVPLAEALRTPPRAR